MTMGHMYGDGGIWVGFAPNLAVVTAIMHADCLFLCMYLMPYTNHAYICHVNPCHTPDYSQMLCKVYLGVCVLDPRTPRGGAVWRD